MVHQEIGAKDVVAILKRRYWLIILLAVFGGGAGFVAARVLKRIHTVLDVVVRADDFKFLGIESRHAV